VVRRAFETVLVTAGIVIAFNLSCFGLAPLPPGSLALAWDPSGDPTVIGYRLYQGTESQVYTSISDIGSTTSALVAGLIPGMTYYFAVTAYDASGLESSFSGEISYTVPQSWILLPGAGPSFSIRLDSVNQATLSGIGRAGYVYSVLVTEDFSSWIMLGSVTANSDGTFQFTDEVSPFGTTRFYRLQQAGSQPSSASPGATAGAATMSSLMGNR